MINKTSAAAFRQNLDEMLNQVQHRHDSIVINKDGKPVAALADALITGDKVLLVLAERYPIRTPAKFWAADAGF